MLVFVVLQTESGRPIIKPTPRGFCQLVRTTRSKSLVRTLHTVGRQKPNNCDQCNPGFKDIRELTWGLQRTHMRKITMVGIPKDIMTVGIKGNYWTEASVSLKRSLSNSSETKVHRRPMSAYNQKSPKRKISRKQSRNPPRALWQQPCDQALPSKLPSLVVVY